MASSKKDEAEKYKAMSIEELKAECNKRKLTFDENSSSDELIEILIKDDQKPIDWAWVYSKILFHTGMHYEEIGRRTIPQLNAILRDADEHISLKIGIPNIFGGVSSTPQNNDGPPKVSQFAEFASMFDGIK